jgi:hypothetical protein
MYLFFLSFSQDAMWFRPAELTTKYGMSGHIVCPVGTHGLFKVNFGRAVQGHDTVCLNLYKRIYPKFVPRGDSGSGGGDDDDGATGLPLVVL